MAINDSKYQNQSSVTIEEIEVQDKPIAVGYQYTIKNVFDGLNKIIRAIVDKFNEADIKTKALDDRAKGVSGSVTQTTQTYNFAGSPFRSGAWSDKISDTYSPTLNGYYTHGYLSLGNEIFTITSSIYNDIKIKSTTFRGNEVGASSNTTYGTYQVSAQIVHPTENTTQLRIVASLVSFENPNDKSSPLLGLLSCRSYTTEPITVKYELY